MYVFCVYGIQKKSLELVTSRENILNVSAENFSDLQLAAELGNTLLERNKDLEEIIRHQQGVIEDQVQEIEVSHEDRSS